MDNSKNIPTIEKKVEKNNIKSRKIALLNEENKQQAIKRAKEIKNIRKVNIKKSSITKNVAIIIFITVFFIWSLTAIFLNKFIQRQLIEYTTAMIMDRLTSIEVLMDKSVDENILKAYIENFNPGENGIVGILDAKGKEYIINEESNLKEKIIELINKDISSSKKISSSLVKKPGIMTFNKNDLFKINAYLEKFIFFFKKREHIKINNHIVEWLRFKKNHYIGFIAYNSKDTNKNFIFYTFFANFFLIFIGITIILLFIKIFLRILLVLPLKTLINKTNIIKDGDLTIHFDSKRKDELGHLSYAFNSTVETLRNLVQKVYIALIVMNRILRTMFKSSKAVTESANAQAVTIQQTRGNFERLNNMVETITNESTKANKYTVQALDKARIGMESIQSLEKEMAKIETSSLEITDIIRMINDIAEQTELLSLNASIESARAGEAGKGFNVVSGEVRKLAEKSTHAANRIYKLITTNNNIIKVGVNYSKNATRVLRDIAMTNEVSAGIVKTISEEILSVRLSSNEILGVINYISEVAQANLMESERVSQATDDLVNQAVDLEEFVGGFDVRPKHIKENQSHIEDILKAKLLETDEILKEYGNKFLPTGNMLNINGYQVNELQVGKLVVTRNNEFADIISRRTNSSSSFFQRLDNMFIRVTTTVKKYDGCRAIGTIIKPDHKIYRKMINGTMHYERGFVVNRWYIGVYKPIIDQTGYVLGALYLGMPEESELLKETTKEDLEAEITNDNTFKHGF
ncbi:MAG: Cache 3/Cache 2 fusion domain-containing protein [Spirochaetes bacterium]|nr:Cache 3/Cache 2 fusion domain-containing protein [Spirochaetota bacterium]